MIELDGFKQSLEIPFAKTVVALALNDFKKDRADRVLGENLQKDAVLVAAVDQYPAALEFGHGFTMTAHAGIDSFVIGRGRLLEFNAARAQRINGLVNIIGPERDVLYAFALVLIQIFFDLTLVVLALIDRNANLAARRGERAGEQTGLLAFDAEVANFPEVEQLLVETGPDVHVAAPDVVREMIDAQQAGGSMRLGVDDGYEVDIVNRALAIAIDQVDQAAADSLDRRDVEFHGTRGDRPGFGAQIQRARECQARVGDAKRHGAGARPVSARESLRKAVVLRVDDEIDVALIVQRHVLGAVARDRGQAHALEQPAQLFGIGRGVLDEFESVGAHRVRCTELGVHGVMMILFWAEMAVPNTRSQMCVVTPKLPRLGE